MLLEWKVMSLTSAEGMYEILLITTYGVSSSPLSKLLCSAWSAYYEVMFPQSNGQSVGPSNWV